MSDPISPSSVDIDDSSNARATATSATRPRANGDPVVAAEIAREQVHVDRVYGELASAARRARLIERDGHRRAAVDSTDRWREEDQSTSLFERDALVHNAAVRLAALESAHEGLVFGRLDLASEPDDPRYIGRLGVRDVDFNPLVIDWRAPAAGAFYRATPVDPHGVVRRRVLRSRGEHVVGIEDDLMVPEAPDGMVIVGDGALIAAITRSRDAHMRDIVATIQADQDEAIRAPWRGVTEITGGPGTGKTVVALHRAAYLLYSERRRFEAGGVLVVGPSAAFSAYIERVLPSLGEDAVAVRSLGQILDGVTAFRHDEPVAAAVKGSLRMRKLLTRAIADSVPGGPDHLRVYVASRIVNLDSDRLAAVRRTGLRGQQRNRSRQTVADELAKAAWTSLHRQEFEEQERLDFMESFSAHDDVSGFLDDWWPVLDPREVLVWFADRERLGHYANGILTSAEVDAVHRSYADSAEFSVEDVALLDELTVMLGSPSARENDDDFDEDDGPRLPSEGDRSDESVVFVDPSASVSELTTWADRSNQRSNDFAMRPIGIDSSYAHIVVDEAQDLSPMQWRMLGRRGRHSSWTVVGDLAQSTWPEPAEALTARTDAFDRLTIRGFKLTRNYRNAAEIFAVAAKYIVATVPDADVPEAVRTTDIEPTILDVAAGSLIDEVAARAADILGVVTGSVALIVPPSLRDDVERAVAALVEDDPRLVVTDPLTTKGLEYDGVVLVEPDRIVVESNGGPRTLYVALTRAAHRLTVIGTTRDWLAE